MDIIFIITAAALIFAVLFSFLVNGRIISSKGALNMLIFRCLVSAVGFLIFIISYVSIRIKSKPLPDCDWIMDSFKAYVMIILPVFLLVLFIVFAAAFTRHKWIVMRLVLSHVFIIALLVISVMFAGLTGRGYMPYYYIRLAGVGIAAFGFITLIPDSVRAFVNMKTSEND